MLPSTHQLEETIIEELEYQLDGWIDKARDFDEYNFNKELDELASDTLYPVFNLATPEYATIRLMGRISISIGRRLGELYDKIPRLLAMEKYDLTKSQVAPKFNGLELDICLSKDDIDKDLFNHIDDIYCKYMDTNIVSNGLGIEIRYNFNPNDSSRLRKDCAMADEIRAEGLTPIYLVYSSISPRLDAIARLERAGWKFIKGQEALDFSSEILGLDVSTIWNRPNIREVIDSKINTMMNNIKNSYGMSEFLRKWIL